MNGLLVPDDWIPRLSSAIVAALREFAPSVGADSLVMLALDCHPWHGRIGISALTSTEVAADETLSDPPEMAAWRFFDFARDFKSWELTTDLVQLMRSAYYSDSDSRPAVTEAFFVACAAAIRSASVAEALGPFNLAEGFRLSVAHPDNGHEYV